LVNPFAYRWQGQCTWYAYGRMLETGLLPAAIKNNALFRGHAGAWRNDALKVGLPVTSTPTAGARGLIVWPPNTKGAGSVGHVAFLEEVYPDGRVRITEANWPTGSGIKERILTPAQYAGVSFVRLENAQTNSYNAPPATPGKQRQYIVRSGDTLSGIAQRELGDANRWREIQKPGGGTFTDAEARQLKVGQSVYLPVGYQPGTGKPVTNSPNNGPQTVKGQRIINAVNKVNAEQSYYRQGGLNDPNKKQTFCNWFVADVLDQLGVAIPRHYKPLGKNLYPIPHPIYGNNPPTKPALADDLFRYFNKGGGDYAYYPSLSWLPNKQSPGGTWKRVSDVEAVNKANNGEVVVASSEENLGHIAIVLPGGSGSNVIIAQAGLENFNKGPVSKGWKTTTPSYFVYIAGSGGFSGGGGSW